MTEESRLVTASFHSTVAASSKKTLVSNRIDLPFKTKRIRASFKTGCLGLLRLYFFISPDSEAPTTAPPNGMNILTQLGPQTFLAGEDEVVDIEHELEQKVSGMYLKVYADNTDTYPHTIDVQITVEIFPREEEKE